MTTTHGVGRKGNMPRGSWEEEGLGGRHATCLPLLLPREEEGGLLLLVPTFLPLYLLKRDRREKTEDWRDG